VHPLLLRGSANVWMYTKSPAWGTHCGKSERWGVGGGHPVGAMVDRHRHEAGNGGYGSRKPTGYRASSTRREPRFRQPQHPDKPDNIPVCSGLEFRDSSVLDGNCDKSEAMP